MEDKKEYLRDMAREHWECGHPFYSDDFRFFQDICKDDGFDVDRKDWSYYWDCFNDCKESYYDDNINEDEPLFESGLSRHIYTGKVSKGGNTALELVRTPIDVGASNLDYFGNHLIDEIKANLKEITCRVGGKIKLAIDEKRIELSMDKDPAPGESVKERRIRGWVYFKSNFDVIMEDRQILKQKVIQAFKGGMADFNDKYKSDYLVCKDMILISDSFKYGNDNKSMYFVFKVEEEKYHNEKPRAVIVESLDIFDSILKESLTKCRESLFDDLNEYQIGVIKDMAKMDIECGHPMDYDNALAICQEDEDLSDVAEDAAEYYIDLVSKGAAAFYEEFKNEYDDWDPDFVAEFDYEDELLHESYHCWEDFYEKGCKLGLNSYMNKLDILHDDYGGFKNVPKDKIRAILDAIPENNYDVYNFTEEMIDYFGFDLW